MLKIKEKPRKKALHKKNKKDKRKKIGKIKSIIILILLLIAIKHYISTNTYIKHLEDMNYQLVTVMNSYYIETPIEKSEETVEEVTEEVTEETNLTTTSRSTSSDRTYKHTINMKVTAYCACEICCGEWSKYCKTASGTTPVQGRTIAVDTNQIPFGTEVYIEGYGTYIAEDTGSAIKTNCIDLYFESHEEARQFGVQYLNISY